MTKTLVERLRALTGSFYSGGHLLTDGSRAVIIEAADRIEQLERELLDQAQETVTLRGRIMGLETRLNATTERD